MKQEKQTFRVFNGFFPYDYKALESEINTHLEKGERLVSLGRYVAQYARDDSLSGYRAHIDVFTGAYEKENEKKLAAYRRTHQEKGWKLAAELDFFYIWYVPADAKGKPVSAEAEYNLMQKMVWSRELTVLGAGIAVLILGIIALIKCSYTDFLTFSGVGTLLAAPLFLIPSVVIGWILLNRVRSQSAYLKRRENLPEPDVHTARKSYRLLYGYLLALGVFVLLVFGLDAVFGYTKYLSIIVPILLACLGTWAVQKIQNVKLRKPLLLVVLVLCGVIMMMMQYVQPQTASAPDSMENVLSVKEISGKDASRTTYRATVSPMVTKHFVYTETDEDGNTAQNEYFYIPTKLSRKLVMAKIQKLIASDSTLETTDASRWNADEAYSTENGAVLILKGKEIFYYAAADGDGNETEYNVPLNAE